MPYCLCMNCGAEKDNVFAPCGNCEHSLKNMHEVAYALGLSERYTQRQELDEFRAQIRRGEAPKFGARKWRQLVTAAHGTKADEILELEDGPAAGVAKPMSLLGLLFGKK